MGRGERDVRTDLCIATETFGIMLPRRLDADVRIQHYLLALFLLSIRPTLSSSLPSFTAQYAASSSTDVGKSWENRLFAALKDAESPADLAEVLKWTMRRPSLSSTPGDHSSSLFGSTQYTRFVKAEQAASYPQGAYHDLFSPQLSPGAGAYLAEVFEVCAAIATHADVNTMSSGRLCLLLGWWLLSTGDRGVGLTWAELYDQWQGAAKRMEHLFYAWIR